jgi:hypothetical protein
MINITYLKNNGIKIFHDNGNSLICILRGLTSLEDCPKNINDHVNIKHNKLTNLKGSPQTIRGGYNCSCNILFTLKGGPKNVGGAFYCSRNRLTSLLYFPKEPLWTSYHHNNLLSVDYIPTNLENIL